MPSRERGTRWEMCELNLKSKNESFSVNPKALKRIETIYRVNHKSHVAFAAATFEYIQVKPLKSKKKKKKQFGVKRLEMECKH